MKLRKSDLMPRFCNNTWYLPIINKTATLFYTAVNNGSPQLYMLLIYLIICNNVRYGLYIFLTFSEYVLRFDILKADSTDQTIWFLL